MKRLGLALWLIVWVGVAAAATSPFSFQRNGNYGKPMITGGRYTLNYIVTNKMPFPANFEVSTSVNSNYSGQWSVESDNCRGRRLNSGESCTWSSAFIAESSFNNVLQVRIKFAGTIYYLPIATATSSGPQGIEMLGNNLSGEVLDIIYDSADNKIIAASESGVVGIDLGQTDGNWGQYGTGLSRKIYSLALSARTLFAGTLTAPNGVYSLNLADVSNGWGIWGTSADNYIFTDLQVANNLLFGATFANSVNVIGLTDPAAAWTAFGLDTVGSSLYSILVSEVDDTIYAGNLVVSSNSIASPGNWQQLGGGIGTVSGIIKVGGKLLAATTSGVKEYNVDEDSWSDFGTGFPDDAAYSIISDGTNVLVGAEGAVWVNQLSNPRAWVQTTSGLPSGPVRKLLQVGSKIYIATQNGVWSL